MMDSTDSISDILPSLAHTSPQVRDAARALVAAVREAGRDRSLSTPSYENMLASLGALRGQPLALPLLAGGAGEGAFVQLADGRRVLDLVSGIGPYVFGHDDQDLLETAAIAAAADVAFQGHVLPGPEYARLTEALVRHAGQRLEHVWLALSGSMAIGARVLERLETEGYLGPDGGIARLAERLGCAFDRLSARLPGVITLRSGLGAMQAFVAWQGDPQLTSEIISTSLEEGVLLQPAGHAPMKVRMLPPLTITDREIEMGFAALERALRRVAESHGIPLAMNVP